MKAIAFSFGTATPFIVIVIPEGAALDTAQLPDVPTPDEPPSENCIAPVDEPPVDGRPVAAPEPVVGDMDPDVNPVPLLVDPLLVDPLLVDPLLVDPLLVDPLLVDPLLIDPPHATSSDMAKQRPTATYLEIVNLGSALRQLSAKLTVRFIMLPPGNNLRRRAPLPLQPTGNE
jgi:hypothetical protein